MPFAAQLHVAILDTILGRLALLFLTSAGGDLAAARHAAAHMLATYQPDNEHELRLAAELVSFSFHALEALGQASSPDIPMNIKLRLQNSAVRLSRAANVAERRLNQRQNARRMGTQPIPAADPPQPQPQIEKALDLIAATRETTATAKTSSQTWTQAYNQRLRDKRLQARQIKENLKKNQPGQTVRLNVPPIGLPATPSQPTQAVEQTIPQ